MDQELNKKIERSNKLVFFFKENKTKVSIFTGLIILVLLTTVSTQVFNNKKNVKISEQYITASLHLSSQELEKSRKIYENIILSKNQFYSLLSLNTILEKDLEQDFEKIMNYFEIVENLGHSKEKKDLILLKKALYLIDNSKKKEGNNILNNLISNDSTFKSLAEEILKK